MPFTLRVYPDERKTPDEIAKDLERKINDAFNNVPALANLTNGEILPNKTFIGGDYARTVYYIFEEFVNAMMKTPRLCTEKDIYVCYIMRFTNRKRLKRNIKLP